MERRKIDIDTLSNYGGVNFEVSTGEDYANNLLQKELFDESYIEKVKEENTNPIVNYEKHIFYPAYLKKGITPVNGPWEWCVMAMEDSGETYAYNGIWGDSYVFINTSPNDEGQKKYNKNQIRGYSSVKKGDQVTFTFIPSSGNDGVLSVAPNSGDDAPVIDAQNDGVKYYIKSHWNNVTWISDDVVNVSWAENGTTMTSDDLDEYSNDMNSIRFNVFLRRRDPDENGDYGEWNTSDEQYWNRWNGTLDSSNRRVMDDERSIKNYGDLLGYMGFNDNDIFYQKNALKKTFLRISIFDSPYRQSQRLLYYSTLFLDSNVLYKKYANLSGKNLPTYPDTKEFVTPLVYQNATSGGIVIPSNELLTTTFTCTSKYDESASSDGFYLYLFETMARDGLCTPLYMKVELNNAKYGKSVPLMSPRNFTGGKQGDTNVGCPYDIDNYKFPEDFTKTYEKYNPVTHTNETHSYVDVNKMYESLYIPIFVRRNNKKNRFEWYIVDNRNTGGDMVINLYEPRINKLQEPITT